MKAFISITGILLIFLAVSYFETPENPSGSAPNFSDETVNVVEVAKTKEQIQHTVPSIEHRLEDKKEEDGYIVETYRTYEIYKDKDGEITDIVPTSDYDHLRYKISDNN
ncbi:hypothetical protein [Oceanobacillus bengalensis]|uniref:Uncharacterized protein n=1 Tax=Oceanobacillus bengalensis TaxID=1435466 RepID=A0A494YXQ3_9BACI|nr:hypothetical protein [Oceanobacillus bengalensis]RKQ14947.1 hypothetical protein D8M05_11850 [Oceanobacillus bengalensis]